MPAAALRVLNELETPPGGWRWRHPRSGKVFVGDAFSSFREIVESAIRADGGDPSIAPSEIHEATAAYLVWRGRADLVQSSREVRRTAGQYASGAKAAFLKWWRESPILGLLQGKASRGEPVFVGQIEGDRRGSICARCPHNVIPSGKGWLQNWSDGQMLKSVEGRKTSVHDALGVCEVCSCELRAAVWWQPDIVAMTTRNAKFARRLPPHCWKRRILDTP